MMTINEFLKRNEKIRDIAETYKIDIDCFDIKLTDFAENIIFKARKDCLTKLEPDAEGNYVIEMQICNEDPVMFTSIPDLYWHKYLKKVGVIVE